MENLYESLYEDIFRDDDSQTFDIDVINIICGQNDISALSKYYNIEQYSIITESLGNSYINIIHVNIRSLKKKLW